MGFVDCSRNWWVQENYENDDDLSKFFLLSPLIFFCFEIVVIGLLSNLHRTISHCLLLFFHFTSIHILLNFITFYYNAHFIIM